MSSHILEVNPDSQLEFLLSHSEANPRCVMTLKHPGTSKDHIAFKVKTTQPRRYLVRPNQGLVAPGTSATISILLVEKDKQALLQSFERLGQPGLDHSKDKFLVQSCTAPESFASKAGGENSELYDALTTMWQSVTSGGSSTPIFNKKLHVRHVVQEGASKSSSAAASKSMPSKLEGSSDVSVEKMSHEQLVSEFSRLRSKYDELLTFSVSLTAERDILSNTLEQTKRDYNREISSRPSEGKTSSSSSASKGSLQSMLMQLLVVAIACFYAGLKMGKPAAVEA